MCIDLTLDAYIPTIAYKQLLRKYRHCYQQRYSLAISIHKGRYVYLYAILQK